MVNNNGISKRDAILNAATHIVKEKGAAQLTLEAVAEKAGVSKGGLLYHFPNKDALINEMVSMLSNSYTEKIAGKVNVDRDISNKWTRAYVETTLDEIDNSLEMSAGLLAAIFINPELLASLQKQYKIWEEHMEVEASHSTRSTVARLAADGLWFREIFGLAPISKRKREQVHKELLRLMKEE